MVQYTYDSSGLRLSKTVNGTITNYYYDDAGQLIRAQNGTNDLWFYYGIDGTAQTFALNGSSYYYLKNLQGDVTGIVNHGGEVVARYTYDAWGKLLTVTDGAGNDFSSNTAHIANINPIRYRSYVYDTESGFYYLTSRYYDPTVGRFISADAYASTGQGYLGHNMFAYCGNNPVNRMDSTGTSWDSLMDFGNALLKTVAVGASILAGLALVASASALTVASGGAAAVAVPAALMTAINIVAATTIGVFVTGIATTVVADVGSNIEYSRTSRNQMQEQVKKGQAPKQVDRVAFPHVTGGKDHVHFKDGTALNWDGTITDKHCGTPRLVRKVEQWLESNGWRVLEK